MIYLASAVIMLFFSLIYLFFPFKQQNRVLGYQSYLAHTSDKTFFHAQKVAGKWFGLFALIQLALGLAIHYLLDWDQYVIVWLLTFYFFILIPLTLTEHELYQYLDRRHELPANYVKPDDRPLIRTKGLKDRLK